MKASDGEFRETGVMDTKVLLFLKEWIELILTVVPIWNDEKEKWYFSIVDVVSVLTDNDYQALVFKQFNIILIIHIHDLLLEQTHYAKHMFFCQ